MRSLDDSDVDDETMGILQPGMKRQRGNAVGRSDDDTILGTAYGRRTDMSSLEAGLSVRSLSWL